MNTRKVVVAAFGGALLCSIFAGRWVHALLGNRLMSFLGGISYQVYLWHMWLALWLKDLHLPQYATERPMDDPLWRFPYMMFCIAATLAVSIALTYGFERPIHRALMAHAPRWARAERKREAHK